MLYPMTKNTTNKLKGNKPFEGKSIERELEDLQNSGTPLQRGIVNMFYSRRKDGVLAESNIRTDKWQLAQNAMEKVNSEFNKKIQEKIQKQKDEEKQSKAE